ncbi:hypothetical protein Lbir_0993 [Legionella birminghamensis]|uniref:Peptidase MA-like domain-containing protein n=1 Tax=Legionella birminghamensis TaxID=28083 RepID=A0A378I5G9_9GAMM|nr:hypothetical protein [Legionella birminghamensis]KTC73937.1 hypothetical protein Lbir_0993 [Legionella birminghamensis]STX30419.1 Uncharacterised protein [Legionella birminghamensis]
MRKIARFVSAIIVLVLFAAIILYYPQLYYFDYNLKYKNFILYSDKRIPREADSLLDKVDLKIKRSPLYNQEATFKIFLRSNYNIHNIMPYQFAAQPFAITRPLIRNIFISKGDIRSNLSFKPSGASRALDQIITHEIVHVLIENKIPFTARADESNWSPMGFLWKEEGYADYIAGNPTMSLDKGIAILSGKNSQYDRYEFEYFKYWFAVKYLIECEKLDIDVLLQAPISLNDSLAKALKVWQEPQ